MFALRGVIKLAGGGTTAYALDRRGQVWAWGSGLYGQLGNGYILVGIDEPTPVREPAKAPARAPKPQMIDSGAGLGGEPASADASRGAARSSGVPSPDGRSGPAQLVTRAVPERA